MTTSPALTRLDRPDVESSTAQEPVVPNHLLREILIAFIAYPLVMYVPIHILLSANSWIMYIYSNLDAELPGMTQFAIYSINLLGYYGIVVPLAVGPLLACIHVALRTDPPKRRRFKRAVAIVLFVASAALLLLLCLPLPNL